MRIYRQLFPFVVDEQKQADRSQKGDTKGIQHALTSFGDEVPAEFRPEYYGKFNRAHFDGGFCPLVHA